MKQPPSLPQLLARTLRRRCPVCGQGALFRTFFTPAERCTVCGFFYARNSEYGQEGYFIGAIAINFVLTGLVPLIVLSVLAVVAHLPVMTLVIIGVLWAVIFPILFHPYACILWIVLDHLMHPVTAAELAEQRPNAEVASPLAAMRQRRTKR